LTKGGKTPDPIPPTPFDNDNIKTVVPFTILPEGTAMSPFKTQFVLTPDISKYKVKDQGVANVSADPLMCLDTSVGEICNANNNKIVQ